MITKNLFKNRSDVAIKLLMDSEHCPPDDYDTSAHCSKKNRTCTNCWKMYIDSLILDSTIGGKLWDIDRD